MCNATAYIGHLNTPTKCPCLTKRRILSLLVQSNSALDTLPWLTRIRKRIEEADPPSAPSPEGEGASLSPVPTRTRLRSSHQPRIRQPLADLPSRIKWEDTPHMRGPTFPSRIMRYMCEPPRFLAMVSLTTCLHPYKPPVTPIRPDPSTARPSSIGDGSCPDKGSQHIGFLAS